MDIFHHIGLGLDFLPALAGLSISIIVGALGILFLGKAEENRTLKNSLDRLVRSFNDLDEQAKLIVKTDLELTRAQEELDTRLARLNALHKISRLISTTLDVDEIIRRLDKSLASELGFEKNLLLMFDRNKNLSCRIEKGFSGEGIINRIIADLSRDRLFNTILREGRTLSSVSSSKQKKEKAAQLFGIEQFILSPILSQGGLMGILFVGNEPSAAAVTEGDEELISILANQIGQSIENAQLFEEVYRARQELESKIQDRTRELALTLEELKRISKAKTDFVSAVSHELRTPLTSIKGYASILMAGKLGDIPPAVRERLEKINKHSDNLVKLINDLLDISRIEARRFEMKLEKNNIRTTIENIRDLLAPQIKEKNIQLTTDLSDQLPAFYFDAGQIERVLINLVGNAVKFTPKNGTITIKAVPQQDQCLLEISDTGIGIEESDIPQLFDEFYRVENEINQLVKGTGLGLTLAKNIIEAHHGKIWITSKPRSGTTVYFALPLVTTQQEKTPPK